jgi:predicted GIY-YIG superfamily endonuclease
MSGYIYKCFKNDNKDIFYIGSTKNYIQRINSHRGNNNTFFGNYVKNNGGFDNFTFEIYEEITDCDSNKLLIREKEIIELLKPYLNTDKDDYRKEICMKARQAKKLKTDARKQEKINNPPPRGRPSKISNENKNEKSTQTDFNELSTQTEFMSLSNNEIIKLRKIINLIKC